MLRFETAGESHGECLVATLTGLPAGVPVSLDYVNHELWRRQQGYGRGGRMKIEHDRAEIVAGVRHSRTIGSPVAILIRNRDWQNWTEALPVEPSASLPPSLPPQPLISIPANRASSTPRNPFIFILRYRYAMRSHAQVGEVYFHHVIKLECTLHNFSKFFGSSCQCELGRFFAIV